MKLHNKLIKLYYKLIKFYYKYTTPNLEIKKKELKELLPDNPIIIEAGAHVGNDTLEMSRLWPKGHIYAFEPVPDIYQRLVKKIGSCKNVTHSPKALSDKTGEALIHVSSGYSDASSSLLNPKECLEYFPEMKFKESIKIKTITLDEWAADTKISNVDLMWLDMQGFELYALKAATSILPHTRYIYTEVTKGESYENNGTYDQLKAFLILYGFQVKQEYIQHDIEGNVLFENKLYRTGK